MAALVVLCACTSGEDRLASDEREAQDVTVGECGVDDVGRMSLELVVVNGSSRRSAYSLRVAFTSPDGSVQYDVDSVHVPALEPGQRRDTLARSYQDTPGEFDCELVGVERYRD